MDGHLAGCPLFATRLKGEIAPWCNFAWWWREPSLTGLPMSFEMVRASSDVIVGCVWSFMIVRSPVKAFARGLIPYPCFSTGGRVQEPRWTSDFDPCSLPQIATMSRSSAPVLRLAMAASLHTTAFRADASLNHIALNFGVRF